MLQECRKDGIREWQHSCVFSLKQLYQVISWPQILLDTFLPHVQSTWWHVTGILECVKGSSIFQTTILCSKSVCEMCGHLSEGEQNIYLLYLWSSLDKWWLTILKSWGVVLLAAGVWPAARNSLEANTYLDLQVSKWPWVMGVADYTCSWLITVITLHSECSLVHSTAVITGPGNHTGRQPSTSAHHPAAKVYFITQASGHLRLCSNSVLCSSTQNWFVVSKGSSIRCVV